MNLEDLIKDSPAGVARFLKHGVELGYKPIFADNNSQFSDAFTIAYGIGESTYMLVYGVVKGTKKYPTKNTVREATGLKGRFDMLKLREQGLRNISPEMEAGNITPFFSEKFDASKLYTTIDLEGIKENDPVKFPAGNNNYFALTLFEVFQALRSLYGKEKVAVNYLFN